MAIMDLPDLKVDPGMKDAGEAIEMITIFFS
jgi:hypothetical protein